MTPEGPRTFAGSPWLGELTETGNLICLFNV